MCPTLAGPSGLVPGYQVGVASYVADGELENLIGVLHSHMQTCNGDSPLLAATLHLLYNGVHFIGSHNKRYEVAVKGNCVSSLGCGCVTLVCQNIDCKHTHAI